MRITNVEKLSMCKEHICERYNYKDTSKLKYWINLYKKHGGNPWKNTTRDLEISPETIKKYFREVYQSN